MSAGDRRIFNSSSMLLADSASIPRVLGCTTGGDLYTFAHRTLTSQRDATLDDSDKTFTVPAGRLWWVHYIYIQLVTTATVGNRRIRIIARQDGANDYWDITAAAAQAASATRIYNLAAGVPHETGFEDQRLYLPIPPRLLLPAAGNIQVLDNVVVDPAADDMAVTLTYDEITV